MASRRKSEELIAQGRVKVNGRIAAIGESVDPRRDTVTVGGRRVGGAPAKRYIMLNKPRGYTTTMEDELGRRCVADLVADAKTRLYPVGRLDRDSEGLLIMTNDGGYANRIMHPSGNIYKVYRVTVLPPVTEEQIAHLENGVVIDGRMTSRAYADILVQEPSRVVLKIAICEGRNRQIRKMCDEVGLTVRRLKRTAIGGLSLGMLPVGKWRELDEKEVGLVFKDTVKEPDNNGNDKNSERREGTRKNVRRAGRGSF